jgi:broad specificity phosphatase PhoE
MKQCKLYVVRHGESEHNRDNIMSGHVDPNLTERGKQQALRAKQAFAHIYFDGVYSSDLQRAVKTAELIYGSPVPYSHQLPGLRERNYGQYDGRASEHWTTLINQQKPEHDSLSQHAQWRYKHIPDAESLHEVSERFIEALAGIAQANPSKTILVGAHGATLRTMLISLGYATATELPSRSIDNAAYVELDYLDGSFTVGTVVGANKTT